MPGTPGANPNSPGGSNPPATPAAQQSTTPDPAQNPTTPDPAQQQNTQPTTENFTPNQTTGVEVRAVNPPLTPDQVVGLYDTPVATPKLPTLKLENIKTPNIKNKTIQGYLKAIEAKMISTEKLMKNIVKLQNVQIITEKEVNAKKRELYNNTFQEYLLDKTIDFGEKKKKDCVCINLPENQQPTAGAPVTPPVPPKPATAPKPETTPKPTTAPATAPKPTTAPATAPKPTTAPVTPPKPVPTPGGFNIPNIFPFPPMRMPDDLLGPVMGTVPGKALSGLVGDAKSAFDFKNNPITLPTAEQVGSVAMPILGGAVSLGGQILGGAGTLLEAGAALSGIDSMRAAGGIVKNRASGGIEKISHFLPQSTVMGYIENAPQANGGVTIPDPVTTLTRDVRTAAGGGVKDLELYNTDSLNYFRNMSSTVMTKAAGGGLFNQLGRFLPKTGTVMAPQGTSLGFQDKLFGINVGGRRTLSPTKTYKPQDVTRYNTNPQAPSTLKQVESWLPHISVPKQGITAPASAPSSGSGNRRLDTAIQNARDITNIPGAGGYKPLVESAASSSIKSQAHYDQLRDAMKKAGMSGADQNMDLRGRPITKFAGGGIVGDLSTPMQKPSVGMKVNNKIIPTRRSESPIGMDGEMASTRSTVPNIVPAPTVNKSTRLEQTQSNMIASNTNIAPKVVPLPPEYIKIPGRKSTKEKDMSTLAPPPGVKDMPSSIFRKDMGVYR